LKIKTCTTVVQFAFQKHHFTGVSFALHFNTGIIMSVVFLLP